jgi:hypothetical protein
MSIDLSSVNGELFAFLCNKFRFVVRIVFRSKTEEVSLQKCKTVCAELTTNSFAKWQKLAEDGIFLKKKGSASSRVVF